MVAAAQAAAGGRASGHVGLNFPASPGVVSEKYSFVALSTDPSTPFAAKGHYELELTTAAGRQNKVHGDVICMGISGNTARIAGRITKLWVNNVQVPIAGPTHNVWVVVDNGEGQGTPDLVSLMQYTIAPGAQFHCATGLPSVVFPNQEGNRSSAAGVEAGDAGLDVHPAEPCVHRPEGRRKLPPLGDDLASMINSAGRDVSLMEIESNESHERLPHRLW
ncbi:MAG: hypothetical protein H7066_01560 [Cytophagaceae bacterium]|nr:hypothetical protein [Gemmatimonadaceae bacterium]